MNEAEARLRAAERGSPEEHAAAADCQYLRGRVWLLEERKRLEQVEFPPHGFDMFGNPIWW